MQSIWQQFTLCFPDTNSLSLDLLFPLLPNSRDTPPNLGPPIFPYYIAGKYLADFFPPPPPPVPVTSASTCRDQRPNQNEEESWIPVSSNASPQCLNALTKEMLRVLGTVLWAWMRSLLQWWSSSCRLLHWKVCSSRCFWQHSMQVCILVALKWRGGGAGGLDLGGEFKIFMPLWEMLLG